MQRGLYQQLCPRQAWALYKSAGCWIAIKEAYAIITAEAGDSSLSKLCASSPLSLTVQSVPGNDRTCACQFCKRNGCRRPGTPNPSY
jgi:hypothetical protein